MKRFYNSLEALQQFTLQLSAPDNHQQCPFCKQTGQFISHGFVYKLISMNTLEIIGKRILCSGRDSRTGCGCTIQLYLDKAIPTLVYHAFHLMHFIMALINGNSIQKAYQQATQTEEPRHAYRWLHKLRKQRINYCSIAPRHPDNYISANGLLSTLHALFTQIADCQTYQFKYQRAFI